MSMLPSLSQAWTKLSPLILNGPSLMHLMSVPKRVPKHRAGLGHSDCWHWLQKSLKNSLPSSLESLKQQTSTKFFCALTRGGMFYSFSSWDICSHPYSCCRPLQHGLYTWFLLNSSSLGVGLYKPPFAGFVDVDLTDKKLTLRSLVCPLHYLGWKLLEEWLS